MKMRGIRGATTTVVDEKDMVVSVTKELLQEMIDKNNLQPDDVCSVFISTTKDVTSVFPASALRTIEGWKFVPIMCFAEIDVAGALEKCIRVMIHANTSRSQEEIEHIYLNEAVKLRPDLIEK